jgi:outer membrane protein OmpA-like peptidoglycan-associated protein
VLVLGCAVALTGCLHGRGTHEIPVTRDYQALEQLTAEEAGLHVDKAHRVGAHHFAPYEFTSAKGYLKRALAERAESDCQGEKDFASLAKMYAEQAIANGSGIEDKGEMATAEDYEEAKAQFDRLVARYRELNPCKAKVVAPVTYAHIELNLAAAEHEIIEKCHAVQGSRWLKAVEADIDAIWAKDTDGDGVPDMHDGQPWIPEDLDGFQDEDGMPEPKPYPDLGDVNFATGSAVLSADAKGYLRGIADMMFDGYSEATIYVAGHTDTDASDTYNMELSNRRATGVAEYLKAQGVTQDVIVTSHYGEAQPVADNTSGAGKAQNRRVEIWLDSPDPVSPFCQ